jgi:hypothetical protein
VLQTWFPTPSKSNNNMKCAINCSFQMFIIHSLNNNPTLAYDKFAINYCEKTLRKSSQGDFFLSSKRSPFFTPTCFVVQYKPTKTSFMSSFVL